MQKAKRGPITSVILDEIGLEGLEGITIPSLWVYLAAALETPLPLGEQLQNQVWSFILTAEKYLLFYELPVERPVVELFDRFSNLDPFFGVPVQAEKCRFPRYKWAPVQDGEIFGSCEFYKERKQVKFEELSAMSVAEVLQKWGNKFVIVGTQELRYNSLTPENVAIPKDLTMQQYCLWEIIGRSRYNGESTAGQWSLQQFCKDSTFVFYMKTRLTQYRLVSCMTFNEKRSDRLHTSTLITLPRFYRMHKSAFNTVIEKLVEVLKATPKFRIEYNKARKYFPELEGMKSFKKIAMTHIFRKIFDVVNIPILEAEDVIEIKEKVRKERQVLVLQLKDPKIMIHNELYADNNETEVSEESSDFHSDKHAFVDMPYSMEFYRTIERHGSRGCSQSDISNYMATHHTNVRQLVKKGVADGLITSYVTDAGRQRTYMYVVVQNGLTVKEKTAYSTTDLKNLKCVDEPNFPDNNKDVVCQDTPSISGQIKLITCDVEVNTRETTQRYARRIELVIQTLNNQGFVSVIEIKNLILKQEKEEGFKDEVCRKSVRRMLGQLSQLGTLKLYEFSLQAQQTVRTYSYAAHPKIDADHKSLQVEMLRLKNSLFLSLEDQRSRKINSLRKQKMVTLKSQQMRTAAKKETKESMLSFVNHQSPKFLVARCLHEFLYYLCYDLDGSAEPNAIEEELLEYWQQTEPSLVINNYLELLKEDNKENNIKAYTRDISWRTFIPPLPAYPEKPAGWLLLVDAVIDRIPLSLFNKIFRLDKSPELNASEFLNHPIRQHYLVKQLPSDMQSQIGRSKLQNLYVRIMKLLNNMGVVQVAPRQYKDPLMLWIYPNRHAEILDTTITEPNYMTVNPKLNYTALHYVFNSLDDVHQYWTTLHRICLHTKLGFRSVSQPKKSHKKLPNLMFIETADYQDAPQKDDGCLQAAGDRLGAGGLSKYLFAHAFRNWSWALPSECKSKFMRKAKGSLLPKIVVKKRKTTVRTGVGGKLSVVPLKRLQMKSSAGRSAKGHSKAVSGTSKKKPPARDAIDRDALKHMRTLRVTWTDEEDEIIKMARTVCLYIAAPIIALSHLTIGKICRDIMRHNLGYFNKTTQSCVRRAHFMVKMKRHLPQVPAWLHLLQTSEELQDQYGDNFLKNLKKAYPNRVEMSNALTVHFVLILNYLYKQVNSYKIPEQPKFLIPDTMTEFRKKFKECAPVKGEGSKYENPQTELDLQLAIIINVLHSSLCSTRDKTLYNLQAFEIYKNFGEEVLHRAFQRARNDGLVIAIRRKHMQTIPSQITGPTYKFSKKYQTSLTCLRIPYGVYDSFYEFFTKANGAMFAMKNTNATTKSTVELKSPNAGQMYFIAENLAQQRWDIDLKLPNSFLTIDDSQPDPISSFDRILDHFHGIFENAPETEYIKQISEEDEKQARIKFQQANLSYKIYYTPFDIISKLPTRRLHFFCALDHLQQEVEINFSKLQQKDDESNLLFIECPFNCIMRHANYINAIERIVQEKKMALRELQEVETPQHLLNLAVGVNTISVQPTNLLTLVRMLDTFWQDKELQFERKDLGKVAATMKITKTIDWHQLCNDILAYNSADEDALYNDEYEPTLSKDDRMTRAQDVFVVNLPTLILAMKPQVLSDADVMPYEGLQLPKMLVGAAMQKDAIIQKVKDESYWKYTENTFEALKPSLQDLNLNAMEIQHLEEIHDYIKRHKLGVPVADLMREFPYDDFLIRALKTLSKHYLIKRVGVSSFMYVHKLHIRNWLVHTFHIKRLEREQIGSTAGAIKRKRQRNNEASNKSELLESEKKKLKLQCEQETEISKQIIEDKEEDSIAKKKLKFAADTKQEDDGGMEKEIENVATEIQATKTFATEQEENSRAEEEVVAVEEETSMPIETETEATEDLKKRISKPPKLYSDTHERIVEKSNVKKDVIVMKPQPWLRLNGSVNRRVLDKWMGSILTECIARTGCFVKDILERFSHMLPVDILFLMELLRDLKCIKLRQIQPVKVSLFSEYEDVKETEVTEFYNPEHTYVLAEADALSKLAIFIGKKKYNAEFI